MKRSEINQAIMEAKKMMEEYLWTLPQWGYWFKDDYSKQPTTSQYLKEHQMGWDVTDFGKGLFNQQGITLFCIRNGIQGNTEDKPYAEKLLFMQEGQEIPYHSHKVKLEDIINRGGGDLAIEFVEVDLYMRSNIHQMAPILFFYFAADYILRDPSICKIIKISILMAIPLILSKGVGFPDSVSF